jgi:hypothetical protein
VNLQLLRQWRLARLPETLQFAFQFTLVAAEPVSVFPEGALPTPLPALELTTPLAEMVLMLSPQLLQFGFELSLPLRFSPGLPGPLPFEKLPQRVRQGRRE